MTLNPKKSSVVLSLLCSWLAIIVAAWVPIWEAHVVEYYCVLTDETERIVLRTGTLRQVVNGELCGTHKLAKFRVAHPVSYEPKDGFLVRQRNNIIALILVCAAGTVVGRHLHRRLGV